MGDLSPKPRVVEFDVLDSTQAKAAQLAEGGAPEWTVVTAAAQFAGRGRRGRGWSSPRGGLYMTVVLRPHSAEALPPLSLAMTFAAAEHIRKKTKLPVQIRWPNDLMIKGRKLGGVLSESRFSGDALTFVLVGVGINCNSKPALADKNNQVTSLTDELGKQVAIAPLMDGVLRSFAPLYEDLQQGRSVIGPRRRLMSTLGKTVAVRLKTGETISYKAVGMTSDGALEVTSGGISSVLRAEDIELLRERS
jgi:BirA family transcriptional regulator, biotin operon repressor / biotin---[acetyl-CoA-carboxylase] ligase